MGTNSNPRKRKRILFAVLLTVAMVVIPPAYVVMNSLGMLGVLQTMAYGSLLLGAIGFAVAKGMQISVPRGFWIAMGAALVAALTMLFLDTGDMRNNQDLFMGFMGAMQIAVWVGLVIMIIQAVRGGGSATVSFEEGIEELGDEVAPKSAPETSVSNDSDTADVIAKIRGNKPPKAD